jgi:transposase-like protein
MADLKTECSVCANNIVVAEANVSENEDATYLCHVCQKVYA